MSVRWIPTSAAAYAELYKFHADRLCVHGTITDLGEHNESEHVMTEWCLPNADYPLIKCDDRNGMSSYYIAVITKEDCDD